MPSMMGREKYDGTISTAEEARKMCVLGNRICAMDEVVDAFGHVTVRNPEDPETFFISWATSPEFVTKDDLQLCDFEGNIRDHANRPAYGERILHARIYKARPDVNAICHGHPASLMPFICSDMAFRPVGNGAALFPDGVPLLEEWDPESGKAISTVAAADSLADVLGPRRAALISEHGIVAVEDCVEKLLTVCNSLKTSAELLFRILQIGAKPKFAKPEELRMSALTALGAVGINRSWNYSVRKAKEMFPDLLGL